MDNSVKIISNNIRGLQNNLKRRKIFHHFNTLPQADIIMLQETHSTNKTENQWRSEWGAQAYFSHGTSEARGVGILIKNNVDFEVNEVKKDDQGRFLALQGSLNNKPIVLANIYGPNNDDINFFSTIQERIEDVDTEFSIIGGDFNCILNNNLDKKGGSPSHANRRNQGFLNTWIEECSLVDIWRQMHPTLRRYTFHKQRPSPVYSRLDFFLISESLTGLIEATAIQPGYSTDHSMITLTINLISQPRGRGHWKLNNSILSDVDYVSKIKDTIKDTVNSNRNISDQLLWDLIKYRVRKETITMSSEKKKKTINRLKALEETLQTLETERDTTGIEREEIKQIREEIEKIQEEKTKGAIIRCKVRWYEEGEKSTKYFLNLEKRNYNKKIISRLKDRNNQVMTEPKEIQEELHNFYKKLYSSRQRENDVTTDFNPILSAIEAKLTDEKSAELEGPIAEAELLEALKSTPNGKSPGSDGLNAEFYKIFWTDIKEVLLNSINQAFTLGELNTTQKHGVITLLPKKGKDPLQLKNWRPISLLNQDYKLIAKCIALRIKKHLKSLIHNDQTGFMKGRYIGENINKILSIMEYVDKEDIPAIVASVDFEKAFDSMERTFILKTLQKFNFGPSLINWVKILYNKTVSCVLNNGWTTKAFELHRGVRQGCPLSPYLFILAAEALSCYIRKSSGIKGITVKGEEHKISQFADDTCLFLKYDVRTLDNTLQAFDQFKEISGLTVNYDKTELFPIGAIKESELPLYSRRNIKWSPKGIKILGIHITHNKKELLLKNYKQIVSKLDNIIKIWKRRSLTLHGKVQVIKAHLQSQLVYQLSVLPSPPKALLDKIQKTLYQYLWDNKPDKIKRTVILNTRDKGGLSMPDIRHQNTALKISWIQRILRNPDSAWASCALATFPKGGLQILRGNISARDLQQCELLPTNKFWSEVLSKWADYSFKGEHMLEENEVNSQPLWYNSHIKIQRKVVFYKKWQSVGIN
jgi:exonuclease III